MSAFVLLVSLAAAAGCIPLTARSSAAVLGPDGSTAVVRHAPIDAAAELVQVFAARGYMLFDQQQKGAIIVLRLHGSRRTLFEGEIAYEIGSVYYAYVAPHADGQSAVTIIGRPTYNDVELCTSDLRLEAACMKRYSHHSHEPELDGRAEAGIVHGVFSELRLRGAVDDSAVPTHRIMLARDLCRTQRQQQLARALEHRNIRVRAAAYAQANKDFPPCE